MPAPHWADPAEIAERYGARARLARPVGVLWGAGDGYRDCAMSGPGRASLSSLLDFAWRTAFRLGFPLDRIWWRLTRPRHEGVAVAVYVGPALLLVSSSYRVGWHLPGGRRPTRWDVRSRSAARAGGGDRPRRVSAVPWRYLRHLGRTTWPGAFLWATTGRAAKVAARQQRGYRGTADITYRVAYNCADRTGCRLSRRSAIARPRAFGEGAGSIPDSSSAERRASGQRGERTANEETATRVKSTARAPMRPQRTRCGWKVQIGPTSKRRDVF